MLVPWHRWMIYPWACCLLATSAFCWYVRFDYSDIHWHLHWHTWYYISPVSQQDWVRRTFFRLSILRRSYDFQHSDERGEQHTETPARSVPQDCRLISWTTRFGRLLIFFSKGLGCQIHVLIFFCICSSYHDSCLQYAIPHCFRDSHRILLLCICFRIALHSRHHPSSFNAPHAIDYLTGKHHYSIYIIHPLPVQESMHFGFLIIYSRHHNPAIYLYLIALRYNEVGDIV